MKEKIKHEHNFLIGLQASGKSTFAKGLVDKYPNVYVRVNKKELRKTLYNDNYSKPNEVLVEAIEEAIIRSSVKAGKFIIWDNTHLAQKHTVRKEVLEKELGITFKVKKFEVSLEEAIERDSKRENSVGEKVIRETLKRVIRDQRVYNQPRQSGKTKAFIVDLDGTLAFNTENRGWYDWDAVDKDTVNKSLLLILRSLRTFNRIIFLSGRDGVARDKTMAWLKDNGFDINIEYDDLKLYMRVPNDNRADNIIKEEIYRNFVEPFNDVVGVFDHRLSVCKMWHRIGLPLYRFGDPEAVF